MEEANNLKTEYKRMLATKDVAHDVAKNDPALRRPIVIQGAYRDSKGRQVMSTPIDNFAMAREIMKTDHSPEALKIANNLMDKGMEQQARVTSSKKIASKSDACHTTLGSNPKTIYGGPRDDESHTGSTAIRRRNARNRTYAIPVDSDSKHHGEP